MMMIEEVMMVVGLVVVKVVSVAMVMIVMMVEVEVPEEGTPINPG